MSYLRTPNPRYRTCRFCGTPDLHWEDTARGNRLVDKNGIPHDCEQYHSQKHAHAAPPSLAERVLAWLRKWESTFPVQAVDEMNMLLAQHAKQSTAATSRPERPGE